MPSARNPNYPNYALGLDSLDLASLRAGAIVIHCHTIHGCFHAFAIDFPSFEWHGFAHTQEVRRIDLVASIQVVVGIRVTIVDTNDTCWVGGH